MKALTKIKEKKQNGVIKGYQGGNSKQNSLPKAYKCQK
jgi:hypothetical protein